MEAKSYKFQTTINASEKILDYTNGFQNPQIKYKKGYEESLKTLPLIIVPK